MGDSVSRKPEENTALAIQERMKGRIGTPPHQKQEIHELPRWVKTALVARAVDGLTYKEAAAKVGKAASTLESYARSPAASKWLEGLEVFLDDPVAMAKAMLSASALSITLERFSFLEAAVAAGDYKEGDKIARDLQDRMGIVPKRNSEGGAIQVKINLGGGNLEAPMIEADWTREDEEDGVE